jgi:hypothetical protein
VHPIEIVEIERGERAQEHDARGIDERTSIPPNSCSTRSNADVMSPSSATSPPTAIARPPAAVTPTTASSAFALLAA